MNNILKYKILDKLNSINFIIYKRKSPFDALSNNVQLTYNEIQLQYIKNKNYFVEVDKSKPKWNQNNHRGNRDISPNKHQDNQNKHRGNRDRSPDIHHDNQIKKNNYKGGLINIYY